VVSTTGDADVRARDASQIEWRVEGDVLRGDAQVDLAHAAVAEREAARPGERSAVQIRLELGEDDALAVEIDVGVEVLSGDVRLVADKAGVGDIDRAGDL